MAITPTTLEPDAFARLVLEENLAVSTQIQGYLYAVRPGPKYELFRTPKHEVYLFQARHVVTQDDVGGGALEILITPLAGQTLRIKGLYAKGTASNTTLIITHEDEDGAYIARLASVAAGVSREANLPSIGAAASSSANIVATTDYVVPPGTSLSVNSAAAAQTEILTVGLLFEVTGPHGTGNEPTISAAGSAGTPNLAASTITEANTWHTVVMQD